MRDAHPTPASPRAAYYSENGVVTTACILRADVQPDGSVNVTTAIAGADPAVVAWRSCWVLRFAVWNSTVPTPVVLEVHRTPNRDIVTGGPVCELTPRPRTLMAWNSPSVIKFNNSRETRGTGHGARGGGVGVRGGLRATHQDAAGTCAGCPNQDLPRHLLGAGAVRLPVWGEVSSGLGLGRRCSPRHVAPTVSCMPPCAAGRV
jgi:hypothetical protein